MYKITPNEAYFIKWILAIIEPAYPSEADCMQPCYLTKDICETMDAKWDKVVKALSERK